MLIKCVDKGFHLICVSAALNPGHFLRQVISRRELRPLPTPYHFKLVSLGSWWRHQKETFPHNWPFVRGIHRSPVNSPHKDQWRGALMFSLIDLRLNKRLSKQSWGWWFETLLCPLWRHCNVLCNIGYPSETHLKLKSREISFAHSLFIRYPIALEFCTAVLCAKFQNDWTTETNVMVERGFAGFEFKMSFGRIYYFTQHPLIQHAIL